MKKTIFKKIIALTLAATITVGDSALAEELLVGIEPEVETVSEVSETGDENNIETIDTSEDCAEIEKENNAENIDPLQDEEADSVEEILLETENSDSEYFSEENESQTEELLIDNTQEMADGEEEEEIITAEESADVLELFADADTENVPYSSIDSLADGTYKNVTVNLYVPGELNTILGRNAYLTNSTVPKDDAATYGLTYGTPTSPVYENGTVIVENGEVTIEVDVVNDCFQLISAGDGDTIHIKDTDRTTGNYPSTLSEENGGRISKLVVKVDNLSGMYTLTNCVEYAEPLGSTWNVNLNLAVNFDEIGKTITTNSFYNDKESLVLVTRTYDLDNLQATIEKIESGDVYNNICNYLENNTTEYSGTSDFGVYKITLLNGEEDISVNAQNILSARLFLGEASSYWKDSVSYVGTEYFQWEDESLKRLSEGLSYSDLYGSTEKHSNLQYANEILDFSFGYIVILKTAAISVKCNYTYTDAETGVSVLYNTDNYFSNERTIAVDNQLEVEKNISYGEKEDLLSLINEEGDSGFTVPRIDTTWAFSLHPANGNSIYGKMSYTSDAFYVSFPVSGDNSYVMYRVVYNIEEGSYVSATRVPVVEQTDGNIKFYAFSKKNGYKNATRDAGYERHYRNFNTDFKSYSDSTSVEFYAIVREGATAESSTSDTTEYTYDGTAKTPVSSTDCDVTITGAKYGDVTESGAILPDTYTATITPKDGYVWSDTLTTDSKTVTWTIKALQATKPTATDVTWNGSEQAGVAAGTGYNLAGTTTAAAVGSYTTKVVLADGYEWSDGTTDILDLSWKINPITIEKPAASDQTWNGSEQTGVTAGTGYTVSGSASATAVGTYAATATLSEGYAWSDGTTDAVALTWTMDKAEQTVSAKTASKTYKLTSLKKKKATFTISGSAEGKVSYKVTGTPSAKAAKYISVDKNGKVTMKKGAPAGTYSITITAAETENYKAGTRVVTIKVNKETQKIKAKKASKTYKAAKLKKKKQSYSIGAKAKGKLTYKVTSTPTGGSKYISVSKKGKVTLKKNAPKGTYKITITAAETAKYAKATKTVKVVVK